MKAKSSLYPWVILICLWSLCLSAQETGNVHLAGLRVVGPGQGLNGTELQPFRESSGITLVLVVEVPAKKKIVELDNKKSSLSLFKDDKGSNLLDNVRWGSFPKISEDGRYALIEVSSKARPASKALKLEAQGLVHVIVAAASVTEKIENLKLEVGTTVIVQQEGIEVLRASLESDDLVLVLQMRSTLKDNIKDIRFFSADGVAIDNNGTGSMTFGNSAQVEYYLSYQSIPKTISIELDLWRELEVLNIPFEIKAGLGL
ncbi:hypothetical protein KAR48_06915 [bacterium]|nr:hypothetical protein [bacterium]